MKRYAPYLLLLLGVVLFYRHVLFLDYAIPWDLQGYHLAHAYLYADSLDRGELPLWDPYTYCGRPMQANLKTEVFYPTVALAAWLGSVFGHQHLLYFLELNVILHVLLAGVFAYWLGLALGLSRPAALVLGAVYQFGGFITAHAEHMDMVSVAAWLPLTWYCILRWRERPRWRYALLLALALAFSILAGFTPTTAAVFASAALLALLLSWRALAMVFLAMAGAVLLVMFQFAPTVQLTHYSIAQYRTDWLKSGGGIPLQALVSLVWPNYYGLFDLATYHQPWELTFMYLYCGILALGLALYALLHLKARWNLLFAVLLSIGAFGMLGDSTWVGRTFDSFLPATIRIALQPEYTPPVFILSLAALAALGLEQAVRRPRLRWMAFAICAADLILVSSGRPMNAMPTKTDPGISRTQFGGSRVTLERVRSLTRESTPPSRIDVMNRSLPWVMTAPITEVPTANGSDPFALARLIQVRLAFCQGERWGSYYEVANLRSPVLGMVNVRYVLSRDRLTPEQLAGSPFFLREEVPGFFIYENRNAMPRFWLVSRVRTARSEAEAAALLRSLRFNPAEEAIVEGAPAFPNDEGPPGGSVRVIRYGLRDVELEVESPRWRYLVSSEANYPGWHAWLDDVEQPLLYTNVAFRGLAVPPGRHSIRMRFNPVLLWWSAAVSLAAWIAWGILFMCRAPRGLCSSGSLG